MTGMRWMGEIDSNCRSKHAEIHHDQILTFDFQFFSKDLWYLNLCITIFMQHKIIQAT